VHFPRRLQRLERAGDVIAPDDPFAVLPSLLINQLVMIQASGKKIPMSYEGLPYLRQQIDAFPSHPKQMFMYGRQTYKSSNIAAQIHAYINTLGLTWQYVSATMEQAREFSQWKLDGAIRDSDILSGFFDQTGTRRPYNVKRKESFAGGRVLVGTAYGDAARIRGNPADALSIDEIALVDLDAIGVLRECLSASTYGWELHAGTPLSTDNPQWIIWSERSKQHEWAVPCHRHSPTVWNVLGVRNLTPDGIVCERCGKPIHTQEGRWVVTSEPNMYTYDSFRLPQIANPHAKFGEILRRLIDEPIVTMRESFAYSVEQAKEVFSDTFLAGLSDKNFRIAPENFVRLSTTRPMVAGIDWAQPDPRDPHAAGAATTLTLGCYTGPEKFTWVAGFRFRGDPDDDLNQICEIIDRVKAHRIVADHGAGYSRNNTLMNRYGFPRFTICKYNRQDAPITINANSFRLSVDRNTCLDSLATNMRLFPHKYGLPCRRDMERAHWWQDLRSVLVEYDSLGNTLFVKRSGKTDDHWHSMFYCFLAAHLIQPRMDVLAPILTKEGEDDD